jgi:type I restriction enzyme S subunit
MSFPRYPKYKDSGVEWLGEVPEHWALKPLWTFFRRVKRTGFDDEQLLSVYRDHGVVPKASRDDNFNKPSDDLSVYQLVIPGDLAINKMKAWQGSVAISEHRGIVSPAYFVYEALHNASSRYLHYLMRSLRYITGYMSVSKGIRVNQWDLEPQLHSRMPLTVPPIEEQTQIAAFLDRETAKIDELVAEQRRLMELLKEKRQAVISHAVTQGLDPDAPMKPSGIEWLGDVPAHWEVRRLKSLVEEPLKYGANESAELDDRTLPRFVRITDIDDTGGLRDETFKSLPVEVAEPYLLNDGDVLLARSGATVGKSFIYSKQWGIACFAGYLIRARLRPNICFAQWLYSFCQTNEYWSYIFGTQIQATIQNVSAEKYANLYLPLPPTTEQADIIELLRTELTKFDTLAAEVQLAIDLLQERRTALISAAVTGQIDVRHLTEREAA